MKLPKKIPMEQDDFVRAFTEIENHGMDKRDMKTVKQSGKEYLELPVGNRKIKILIEE